MTTLVQPLGNINNTGKQGMIGSILYQHVRQPVVANQLRDRNLRRVLRHHSGTEKESMNEVFKAYKLHQDKVLGVFVLKVADAVIGMATVDPTPILKKLRFEIPPRFAKGLLAEPVEMNGPQVTAWINPTTVPDATQSLSAVYRQLKDANGPAKTQFDIYRNSHTEITADLIQAWTVEPFDSASWVHSAIKSAGYINCRADVGYFDDGVSGRHSPPSSRLYIAATPLNLT